MATTATQLPAAPAPAGTAVAASTTAAAAQRPRPPRKITAHRKSRTGCRNCKLRKVRCDETRPKCIKCDTYGILCNYDPRHEDLQWSTGTKGSCSGVVIDLSILDLCRNLSSESGCLASSNGGNGSNTSDDNSNSSHHSNTDTSISQCQYAYKEPEYQPLPEDRETLKRFFSRTVYTLAPRHCVAIYRDIYSKLCESNPFLMHIILAVTLVHDTTIKQSSSPSDTEAITRHWSQGASLLNHTISQPLETLTRSTRDAMWACASLLGCLAMSILEADRVDHSWPLKVADSHDLDWLNMCAGKTIIFQMSDPLQDDSLWAPARQEMAYFMSFRSDLSLSEMRRLNTLPDELIDVCGMTAPEASEKSSCCYRAPLSLLAQLMPLECDQDNYVLFLGFFRTLGAGFKDLLAKKDPVALLLLLFWYAKVSWFDAWWVRKRVDLEYRAIMRYLVERCGDDGRVVKLVCYVNERCSVSKAYGPG